MVGMILALPLFAGLFQLVVGHAALVTNAMWGWNATMQTYSYDNRAVAPLQQYTFDQWWFHNHFDNPPQPGIFFELPAGQTAVGETVCDVGASSFWQASPGGDVQNGTEVCPGSPSTIYHANNEADVGGCGLSIAYNSDEHAVQPEDFVIFSINQVCVWTRFNDFPVPAKMPACPSGGCICAFHWIHNADSGSEQMFMNMFRCQVTGATSTVPVKSPGKVPRRCGQEKYLDIDTSDASNCTWGAKTPMYWYQKERNNMFEGTYSPPLYNSLYNFAQGAQNDIFEDSVLPTWKGATNPDNEAGDTAPVQIPSGTPQASSVKSTPSPSATVVSKPSIISSTASKPTSSSGSSGSSGSAPSAGVGNVAVDNGVSSSKVSSSSVAVSTPSLSSESSSSSSTEHSVPVSTPVNPSSAPSDPSTSPDSSSSEASVSASSTSPESTPSTSSADNDDTPTVSASFSTESTASASFSTETSVSVSLSTATPSTPSSSPSASGTGRCNRSTKKKRNATAEAKKRSVATNFAAHKHRRFSHDKF